MKTVDLRVSRNGFGQLWPAEIIHSLYQIKDATTDTNTKRHLDELIRMIVTG